MKAQSVELFSFVHFDRSARVRWTCAEIGLSVFESSVEPGEHLREDFASLNPLGRIPAVRVGRTTLAESGAISLWLCERAGAKHLAPPPDDPRRPEFLFWTFAGCSTLENMVFSYACDERQSVSASERRHRSERLSFMLARVTEQIVSRLYLLGSDFTIADICVAYPLQYLRTRHGLGEFLELEAYLGHLADRPAAKQSRFFDSWVPNDEED